jgi:hypothetical protein
VNNTIKQSLLASPTALVSTAIGCTDAIPNYIQMMVTKEK